MNSLSFRFAGVKDVAAINDLVQSAYRGDSSRKGWTHEADLLQGQRTDYESIGEILGTDDILLALIDEQMVGCCQIARRGEHVGYLGMFSVDPKQQGGGIGRAIVTEAERVARKNDCNVMTMSVIAQRHDLIAWYERIGYIRTGETQPFPYGDERFGIPQRDDLYFVALAKPL